MISSQPRLFPSTSFPIHYLLSFNHSNFWVTYELLSINSHQNN
jgi:hypothetical protein